MALCSEINYVSPNSKIYKDIIIASYPKPKYPSFFGKVIESEQTYIIVEPDEGEEIRKTSDKFSIGLGKDNDAIYTVGTNVKITHTGIIRETYPAQIDLVQIELNYAKE